MPTTHVFIVDITTIKYHIEHLFAGTGAKKFKIDFNNLADTKLHHSVENLLVGMIADFQRVRKNDLAIFYLQQNLKEKIYEGRFFGVFKVTKDLSFLDNFGRHQYLKRQLKKSLTFRTLLKPYEVYARGVSEWEALDEIRNTKAPYQMIWSLIYRKLRAKRGNTMITTYESEKLIKLIRDKNNRKTLSGRNFTFDISKCEIASIETSKKYEGNTERINIFPRLIKKYGLNNSFEVHLQAYITENIGRMTNKSLDNNLLLNKKLDWIGNEVYCGVGMQRIDILLSLLDSGHRKIVVPIELKTVIAHPKIVKQIDRYIDWLEQYYIPNSISDIQPVLISAYLEDKESLYSEILFNEFNRFNERHNNCYPLKYIEYYLDNNNNLKFKEYKY